MNKGNAAPQTYLSKSRKLIFSAIAMIIPFVFLILMEIILRFSGYGDNYSLFVNHPDKEFSCYMVVNPEIGKKYFQKMEYSSPAKDIFLKEKPKDVFRIFVLGSSTVVGFPYDNNLMFTRILSERLRDAYPGKKIEMVNTAITAINSFTLADFTPQILNQNPDAILIYAGHNEFYGAFGAGSNEAVSHSPALIRAHLSLMNYRVYQLVVRTVGKLTGIFNSADAAMKKRGTLMTRMVKDADITFGSDTYNEGINNFGQNMDKILTRAEQKNVPVFISNLFSNLRDLKPFKSIPANGIKGADEYYNLAAAFEVQGKISQANENYVLARDYDCIRFRASSDINQIIKKLAEKHHDYYVPTLELFNENSPNGIVGNNLLTEHVHPNISGQFLLAESFYKQIVQSKLIDGEVNPQTEMSLNQFIKEYGYSKLDSLIGVHRIKNLSYHWPFQDESKGYVDYREIYRPTGLIDSLAFNVMAKQQISLMEAHEILAKKYKQNGNYLKAFQEYNCLTKINPYWSSYFRNAGDCLLNLCDLPNALKFFERSTEHGQGVFYAHFRAGEICLIKNDLESALSHFQKSQETATKEEKEKALYKIYQTLTYMNRSGEGNDIVAYFTKTNRRQALQIPPRTGSLMDYVPFRVKANVDAAKEAIAQKDYKRAVDFLQVSLNIQETSIAFRMLGELYLQKEEFEKSRQLLMKAYPDFQFDASFLRSLIKAELTSQHSDEAQKNLQQLSKVNAYIHLGS
jgi:tetratricopeptide (TPR) repeat protein